MNKQRTKQLEKLQELASEIENTLEDLWDGVDAACDSLECANMEHLPAYERLQEDRDNLTEAQTAAADLWTAIFSCIEG